MFSNGHFLLRALQADRHRCACPQSDEQIIVRPGGGITATHTYRLVGTQLCAPLTISWRNPLALPRTTTSAGFVPFLQL